jgi:hypothetical protein
MHPFHPNPKTALHNDSRGGEKVPLRKTKKVPEPLRYLVRKPELRLSPSLSASKRNRSFEKISLFIDLLMISDL